ncbi:hypothetical protein [Pseudonocardia sp. ICBG601]|uniref:hypothetical protein n=1 Tax=Pseudonocardia sp. ICBG601 TaxID=2846759 RepID=UPI001CF6D3B4|nr:hypothetical protein [Pseudonocardia sp. ICBG601]
MGLVQAAVATAERFARLWASPNTPKAQWLRRLQPLATPEYGHVILPQVDPANIPADRVVGAPRVVSADEGVVMVVIELDRISIQLDLLSTEELEGPDRPEAAAQTAGVDGGWRVAAVAPLTGG